MTKKQRFSATDWVNLGLQQLAVGGPDAVKLEAICAAAKLTRGSFYYHFSDHSAFLLAIVQSWQGQQTDDIVAALPNTGTADDNAKALTKAVLEIDYRLELGIRELARRVPDIDKVVKTTDQKRLQILSKIYSHRFQVGDSEAKDLAFLEYAAFSGMILLAPDLSSEDQRGLAIKYDTLMQNAHRR